MREKQNIATVRWLYEESHAKRRVDVPGVEDRAAPGYRFHARAGFPGRTEYRLDEMVDLWADLDATFTEHALEPQGYEAVGPSHVLVTLRQRARLRGSDEWIDDTIYMLWRLDEDGRARETHTFGARAEAVEAAGPAR